MQYAIRKITPAQLAASATIIRAAFGTVAQEFGFTPENNPGNGAFIQPETLERDYERGITMLGLFQGEAQVGFAALEKAGERLYYLEKLAVAPPHRHHGGGRQLMDAASGYVRQMGGGEISIAIINENTRLKAWYESYGFVKTGLKQFEHLTFTVCFMALGV